MFFVECDLCHMSCFPSAFRDVVCQLECWSVEYLYSSGLRQRNVMICIYAPYSRLLRSFGVVFSCPTRQKERWSMLSLGGR